jgi:cycloartenol synthase
VILSYQNRDGGMATYENTRSFHALEVRETVRGESECAPGMVARPCARRVAAHAAASSHRCPSHITRHTPHNTLACQILNPAETFGDIIVDYSYVECTSACITALAAFDRLYPSSRCVVTLAE